MKIQKVVGHPKIIFYFPSILINHKSFQERNQTIKEYKKSLSATGEDSEKCKQSRPALPDGTKIISIPVLEMEPEDPNNADENNPLRQKIVKKSKKDWVLNPAGNFLGNLWNK